MPERVRADALGDPSTPCGARDRLLHDRLVQMKARWWPPSRIRTHPRRRKDELPPPLGGRVRVFAVERERQHDSPKAARQILLVLPPDRFEMVRQRFDGRGRQNGRPILLTLAAPNDNLPPLEIEVFHAQFQTFLQPQPRAVKESDDHPRDTIEVLQDARDLVAAEDDRHTNRHASARHMFNGADIDVQHLAIHKQHRAERLILCRGADAPIRREPGQKFADLCRAHLRGMPLSVKEDVSPNPIDVRAFRSTTVMLRADGVSNAIEQLWLTTCGNRGPRGLAVPGLNGGVWHFGTPFDDDGIVGTKASTTDTGATERSSPDSESRSDQRPPSRASSARSLPATTRSADSEPSRNQCRARR